jgi:hypothetical protein
MSSLRLVFEAAIKAAFPQCYGGGAGGEELAKLAAAVITRCGNPAFGDFQCNNAMALSKALKGLAGYSGAHRTMHHNVLCFDDAAADRGERREGVKVITNNQLLRTAGLVSQRTRHVIIILLDGMIRPFSTRRTYFPRASHRPAVPLALSYLSPSLHASIAGPVSPKDVAERILCALPENPIISATSCAVRAPSI